MSEELRAKERIKALEDRVAALETEMGTTAKGLKRASIEIESEWGEEILPEGTEIRGIKF